MQGHKQWACPNISENRYAQINREMRCEICGDRGHPTNDCPEKREGTDIALRHDLNKFIREMKAKEIMLH